MEAPVKTEPQVMSSALLRNGWKKFGTGVFTHGDSGQVWVHKSATWDHIDKHGYYLLSGHGMESLTLRFGLKGKKEKAAKIPKVPTEVAA
jgi:hypothetical protein